MRNTFRTFVVALLYCTMAPLLSQDKHHYQNDFSIENFTERRTTIMETIGDDAIALIKGASGHAGFSVFRQSNTFYYLTGVETDHAYLMLNGKNRRTTL